MSYGYLCEIKIKLIIIIIIIIIITIIHVLKMSHLRKNQASNVIFKIKFTYQAEVWKAMPQKCTRLTRLRKFHLQLS